MKILKNHFNQNDTVIYANIVSNGCQTFEIEKLDEICQEFDVPDSIKKEVIEAFEINRGKDDVTKNIFDNLTGVNDKNVYNAVILGTQSKELLNQLSDSSDSDVRLAVASKDVLPKLAIKRLVKDDNWLIRATIAILQGLSNVMITNLS